MDTSFPSTTPKRSEKDEKAISEIYKTLVTSFHPGKHLVLSNKTISICQRIFSSNKKNRDWKFKLREKRLDHSIQLFNG
jgi:hypothetical protein